MLIKVREATFGFRENPSPKLHDYSTQTRSWLPVLAATTNQPFGKHFKHVYLPANSPCLPPLSGLRFLLGPKWEFDFDLGLRKEVPFVHATLQPFFNTHYVHDAISLEVLNLYFTYNLMWHICVIPCPTKRKVMSSSYSIESLLFFCQSIVGFFYGILGMFRIRFIHPRCLYWMVSFPLDQILPLSSP